ARQVPPKIVMLILQDLCTIALNLYRQIAIYLAPVLPKLAEQTGELLNDPIHSWSQAQTPLVGTPVNKFKHLMQRVETDKVQKMMEESKQESDAQASADEPVASAPDGTTFDDKWNDGPEPLAAEPLAETCDFNDFMKVDLRIARVVEAGHVEGADKLLQLTLSLGGGETRNVFAGIKKAYKPEELVGRLVMYVANLAPRKMKFGVSTGMVAASGPGGEEVFLLSPDEGAKPGQRVH
ncbi:MAG: methionine--tRNA ligase subunit beta, partial [Planctomycetota bacterium]